MSKGSYLLDCCSLAPLIALRIASSSDSSLHVLKRFVKLYLFAFTNALNEPPIKSLTVDVKSAMVNPRPVAAPTKLEPLLC